MAEESRVVAVTGAASGIGRAVAAGFVAAGATVIALACDEQGLANARFGGEDHGTKAVERITLDVTCSTTVDAAISRILEDLGFVDVLVNAAGVSTMRSVVDLSEEEWNTTLAVNATGVFLMTRAVLPSMLERHSGSIVNIASAAGKRGSRYLSHYAASKFAVIGFSEKNFGRHSAPSESMTQPFTSE